MSNTSVSGNNRAKCVGVFAHQCPLRTDDVTNQGLNIIKHHVSPVMPQPNANFVTPDTF